MSHLTLTDEQYQNYIMRRHKTMQKSIADAQKRLLSEDRPADGVPEPSRELRAVTLDLPWPPTGNTISRHTKAGLHYTPTNHRAYRETVSILWYRSKQSPLRKGRLHAVLRVRSPTKRLTDLDNLAKPILDAIARARMIDNDRHVRHLEVIEDLALEPGTVWVIVQEME